MDTKRDPFGGAWEWLANPIEKPDLLSAGIGRASALKFSGLGSA